MKEDNMQLLKFLQFMEMFRPDLASRVTLAEENNYTKNEMHCDDWIEIGN
jgi:hypothetical protein